MFRDVSDRNELTVAIARSAHGVVDGASVRRMQLR